MKYPSEKNDGNFASCATRNDAVSRHFFLMVLQSTNKNFLHMISFHLRQTTNKHVDITWIFTESSTDSVPQIARHIERSNFPVQPSTKSNAVWCKTNTYQFWCTRCAFRLLNLEIRKKLWNVYKSQKTKWLSQICRRIELCMREKILRFEMYFTPIVRPS
jgi:hypothetical protein